MARTKTARPRATAPKEARAEPKQARALQTREMLLDVAGQLLAEVGIERISTNLICQRAGVTPPALYRYFDDKFAIIEALGMRLMERQNAVLVAWIEQHVAQGVATAAAATEQLLRETAAVTRSEPGGVWIERALHATPRLEHIRIESHRFVTECLTEALAPQLPDVPREAIWRRIRVAVEFGYVVDELLHSEADIPEDALFAETSALLRAAFLSWTAPVVAG